MLSVENQKTLINIIDKFDSTNEIVLEFRSLLLKFIGDDINLKFIGD